MDGKAYVFCRPSGANGFGHVGGAFQVENGEFICFGTENPLGEPYVLPARKGFWSERHPEHGVVGAFNHSRVLEGITCAAYDFYKVLVQPDPDYRKALETLSWCAQQPYVVWAGPKARTCEDDVCDTLSAYRLWMPWTATYPAPNAWFGVINSPAIPVH